MGTGVSLSITPMQKKTPVPIKSHFRTISQGVQRGKIKFESHRVLDYEEDNIGSEYNKSEEKLGSLENTRVFHNDINKLAKPSPVNLINKIHFSNPLIRVPLSYQISPEMDSKLFQDIIAMTRISQKIKPRLFFKKGHRVIENYLKSENKTIMHIAYSLYATFSDKFWKNEGA